MWLDELGSEPSAEVIVKEGTIFTTLSASNKNVCLLGCAILSRFGLEARLGLQNILIGSGIICTQILNGM